MKIVSLYSSPRPAGNTAYLVKGITATLERLGAEVVLIDLAKEELQFCKGCMACLRTGECSIPDSLMTIRQQMIEADGFVLGSPTYALAPNAIMKNFLDRIGIFNAYSSMFGDKYIVGVSTAGGIGARKVAKMLTSLVQCAFRHGKIVGTLHALVGHDHVKHQKGIDKKIDKIALKLYNAVDKQKNYPFKNLFAKLLQKLVLHRVMYKNLMENKDGPMKGVYDYLIKNDILKG